jgi:hypothetical protein
METKAQAIALGVRYRVLTAAPPNFGIVIEFTIATAQGVEQVLPGVYIPAPQVANLVAGISAELKRLLDANPHMSH